MSNEEKIIERLDSIQKSLNDFKVGQARKVTRLETKMNGLLWTVGVIFVSFVYSIRDFFK